MWNNLTGTSILWILIGAAAMLFGLYLGYANRFSMVTALINLIGLSAVGIGCVAMGLTNGFTDHSPNGRLFGRIGMFAFIIGIPMVGYSISRYF